MMVKTGFASSHICARICAPISNRSNAKKWSAIPAGAGSLHSSLSGSGCVSPPYPYLYQCFAPCLGLSAFIKGLKLSAFIGTCKMLKAGAEDVWSSPRAVGMGARAHIGATTHGGPTSNLGYHSFRKAKCERKSIVSSRSFRSCLNLQSYNPFHIEGTPRICFFSHQGVRQPTSHTRR